MDGMETPAPETNGHREVKTLKITLNGRPYSMPADVAASMLESWARSNRKAWVQAHANAILGEEGQQ